MISPRPANRVPASQGVGMKLTIATCLAAALLCGQAALSQEAGKQPPAAGGPDLTTTNVASAPTGTAAGTTLPMAEASDAGAGSTTRVAWLLSVAVVLMLLPSRAQRSLRLQF